MQKVKISRWGSPKIGYYTKLSHCKRNWDFSCKIVAPRNFFVFNGDFGGFQWGNFQNSEFAYYASKSGKCIKQTPTPPFWGDVGVKKWSQFFYSGTWSPIFGHPKMGTFAKSAHFQVPENGFWSARIKKLRPLFHANIPPKWWSRCLFYSFTTFGRVIGKFWILNILSSFSLVFTV